LGKTVLVVEYFSNWLSSLTYCYTYRDDGMEKLLLFLSPYDNPQKDAVAATLAWLTDKKGLKFEVYYEAHHSGKHFSPYSPEDHFGNTVVGGFHRERFYFVSRLFDVKCAIHAQPKLFSSSFLKSIRANIIVETQDLLDFYQKLFSHFKVQLPQEIVLVETRPFRGNLIVPSKKENQGCFKDPIINLRSKFFSNRKHLPSNLINVSPYCYPEIFYRQALGVGYTSPFSFDSHKIADLTNIYTLFLPDKKVDEIKKQGFNVRVIDEFQQGDTYWSITNRIMSRWRRHSNGVTFSDPVLTSYWLPWLCRHKKLATYEPFMEPVRSQMRDLILGTEDKIVYGRHSSDRDITELSKDDIIFQIMDPGRPPFPIIEEASYRMYQPEKNYYEFEPDENTLKSFADERKILCTFLFYCPDIRHVEVLPRILELATLTRMKTGIAITAQWYQMIPEILEMINVPLENGVVFPNVEPLLCSAGMGVGVEAKGFLKETTLRKHLMEARKIISETAGSKFLPRGYYPFLDTLKDYPYSKPVLKRVSDADPSFKIIEELGFKYSISYLSPGKPKTLFKSENFIAINHTSKQWHPYSPFLVMSDLNEIEKLERNLALRRKPGWIIVSLDSPLWLFSYYQWQKSNELFEMASYISRGGRTGKLISATPHIISRYARILDEKGKL